jgi:DNA-binding CsgD family transcriptional regulator
MAMRRPESDDAPLSLPAPSGLRAARFQVAGEEVVVLSFAVAPRVLPESLSRAEREVALEMIAGQTNRQIAAARGTSVRTVANQVNAILRKTGASSRAELIAGTRRTRGR